MAGVAMLTLHASRIWQFSEVHESQRDVHLMAQVPTQRVCVQVWRFITATICSHIVYKTVAFSVDTKVSLQ